MTIVLDSDVAVSAFVTRGLCHTLFEACLLDHQLILSDTLLKEIGRVLHVKFLMPAAKVSSILAFLEDRAEFFRPASVRINTCRDPDDLRVLGLAVAADAEALVTGDKNLLVLKAFQGIPILSPRQFWFRIRQV